MLGCHCRTRGCHTGGRDAIAHLGACLLNHVIDGLHHAVDVVAAPISKRERRARGLPLAVVFGTGISGNAAGIEVVVIENAVHVIVRNDFMTHCHDAVDGALLAWVKDDGRAVGEQPAVILEFLVIGRVPVGARAPAVGVHPGMALHAALVATFHDILQGVKARVSATGAGQVT